MEKTREWHLWHRELLRRKQRRVAWLGATVMACVTATLLSLALAEEPPPVVGKTVHLAWDPPTTNEDGSPCDDLAGYILAVAAQGVDLHAGGEPLQTVRLDIGEATSWQGRALLENLPAGLYTVWVRAFDLAGNMSAWSTGLDLPMLDPVAPGPATNVRRVETIILELRFQP